MALFNLATSSSYTQHLFTGSGSYILVKCRFFAHYFKNASLTYWGTIQDRCHNCTKKTKQGFKFASSSSRTLDTLLVPDGIQFSYVKVVPISFYNRVKMQPQEKWPLKTMISNMGLVFNLLFSIFQEPLQDDEWGNFCECWRLCRRGPFYEKHETGGT